MSAEAWRDVVRALDRYSERLLLGELEPLENRSSVYASVLGIIEAHEPDIECAVTRVLEATDTALARKARIDAAYEQVNGPT